MLKELIIIENGKEYQFSTLEEIVKALIDRNYYEMSKEQRIKRMKMLALANSINNKVEIEEKVVRNSEIEGTKQYNPCSPEYRILAHTSH